MVPGATAWIRSSFRKKMNFFLPHRLPGGDKGNTDYNKQEGTMNTPLAYFITFRTYGTWLRGDQRGWWPRAPRQGLPPAEGPAPGLRNTDAASLRNPPVRLSDEACAAVRAAVLAACRKRGWCVLALSVQATHTHLVVVAQEAPEHVMATLKAWATRRLRATRLITRKTLVWARHGSTVYLWDDPSVTDACDYVLHRQSPGRDAASHQA